jgi:hypothetical protein
MAVTTIPSAGLTLGAQVNFRNLIINGDMSIAQRGTVTGITASSYGGPDRFRLGMSNLGTWTISQDTDVPTGQGFVKSFKVDCTTADASPAGDDEGALGYRFEGQLLQSLKKGTSNAESVTLSFWVKSNKTGTYIAELFDTDNSRHINKSYTINSANTWEKKTITYAGDTTGTLDNDNARSLQLNFWLGAGANAQSGTLQTSWGTNTYANRAVGQVNLADSTSNEWYITGVQLEVGTSASDFEFLPYDVNLNRCERYFQFWQGWMGMFTQTTQFASTGTFRTQMRSAPSASIDGVAVFTDGQNDFTQSSANGQITAGRVTTKGIQCNFGNISGATQFRPGMQNVNANDSKMKLDAEL